MVKRKPPGGLNRLLEVDVALTKKFVDFLLKFASFKSLRTHCSYLEFSCHGVVWLALTLAFTYFLNNKDYFETQLNLLFGLILDIIFVALIKAFVRRRRPTESNDLLTIGPDKFSFPSGHASRAFFVFMFFVNLAPISMIFWSPLLAWAASVALSRLILRRHYILDVLAGIVLGILEALVLWLLWIPNNMAVSIVNSLSSDYLPGGSEDE